MDCPQDITQRTDPGESTATVTWQEPQVEDCHYELQATHSQGNFSIGVTDVVYTAIDGAGNRANCSFFVSVIGKFK